MFARTPRYTPARPGIHSTAQMRATGQNDSSRHILVLLDSSSKRINEQSSGLLIRGFGVQVPGGAPARTDLGFYRPRSFFICPICPHVGSVLARELGPGRGGLVKSGRIRATVGAAAPELARQLYGQWSRPSVFSRCRVLDATLPMLSRRVKPAGNAPRGGTASTGLASALVLPRSKIGSAP